MGARFSPTHPAELTACCPHPSYRGLPWALPAAPMAAPSPRRPRSKKVSYVREDVTLLSLGSHGKLKLVWRSSLYSCLFQRQTLLVNSCSSIPCLQQKDITDQAIFSSLPRQTCLMYDLYLASVCRVHYNGVLCVMSTLRQT